MKSTNETTWVIDPTHTEIQFKVKHLVIANVTGSFEKFEGSMVTNKADFSDAKISFSADVDSIDTKVADRDTHLKSPDFFDAANYPKLHFKSKDMVKKGDSKYQLIGDFTARGTTREVMLDVEFGGVTKDPWGNTKAGFELSGKINRKDYGLVWNAVTETGGVVVSDEVKILANVEMAQLQN